jgi:hypothetical protein
LRLPSWLTLPRALIALGVLVLIWAALYMTSSTIGGPPDQLDFAHRRTYDQIKQSVHSAALGMAWRAALGGALIWLGARLGSTDEGAA